MDDLGELARSVERDPAEVARATADLARQCRESGDLAGLSRVNAIAGRAYRMLGEIGLAERALAEAVETAEVVGDDELAADAHLGLAGVLALGASFHDAFAHLDHAVRLGSERVRDHAELQRAVLHRRAGQVDEAMRLFTAAIPRLRVAGAEVDLARVLANRGGIAMSRGDIAAAVTDFEEAEALFQRVGQGFAALQVRHNLACALAHGGDLPRALQLFDDASAGFAALGHDASVPLLSRAEALITAGLSADALAFSTEAARRLAAEGNHSAAAEALVALARAARVEGEPATAADAARRAVEWFGASRSSGWMHVAELEQHQAELALGEATPARVIRLGALVERLGDAGESSARSLARVLLVETACAVGDMDAAVSMMSAWSMRASACTAEERLAHAYASAVLADARRDRARARRHARRALAVIGSGSGVASAGAAGIGDQVRRVAALSMRFATDERDAARALEWMERSRRCSAVLSRAVPSSSPALADAFARLRVVSKDLHDANLEGVPAEHLRREVARQERAIDLSIATQRRAEAAEGSMTSWASIRERARTRTLVSIGFAGDRAVAIVVAPRRSCVVDLGSRAALVAAAERARRALRGVTEPEVSSGASAARRRALDAAVAELEQQSLAKLGIETDDVILVVPAELLAVPWAAAPSLSARAFSLAPSVESWMRADAIARDHPHTRHPVVAAIAGPRLAEADLEARAVAAAHRDASVLCGREATVAATQRSLETADVVHIAAHGRFRHDNPLWSTLELADGFLTVYDIERLERTPATMVLASCDTAIAGPRSGAQLLGIATSLLARGTRSIVAAIGALPDSPHTRELLVGLHADLATGVGPAASLASRRTGGDGGVVLSSWGLVTLGAA